MAASWMLGHLLRRAARRPDRPRRARRRSVLKSVALVAMVAGAALLGHLAFRHWGTGIATARSQERLRVSLEEDGYPAAPAMGEAAGFLRIPRLRLEVAFVEGIRDEDLEKGPGHYPDTPLPGQGGNVAIAGHRTTHGAPFWSLETLVPGDHAEVRTRAGDFLYRVEWVRTVDPDDGWVVDDTAKPSLTLTTCEPRFSNRHRLVVRAVQVYGRTPNGFVDHRGRGVSLGVELFGRLGEAPG